jgi:cobalt-zinc-cadmium efflux system membrane fusion protein
MKLARLFDKNTFFLCLLLGILSACEEQKPIESPNLVSNNDKPEILDNGREIRFKTARSSFSTLVCAKNSMTGTIESPAKVVASVFVPENKQAQNIILFENTDVTELYTTMLQSIAHLARDTDVYNRNLDMYSNGAATGKDVLEAKTGMIEAATELAEKEARLRTFGFKPQELRNAPPGIVWLFANVSEGDLKNITTGKDCKIEFISYSGEIFKGNVSAIGEVVNTDTRTFTVRITLANPQEKFKPGMFAKVSFDVAENNILTVPQSSLITAEGKTYLFKKKGNSYFRSEVLTGKQLGDNVLIIEGLQEQDTIVTQGTMLLKGLSFGY